MAEDARLPDVDFAQLRPPRVEFWDEHPVRVGDRLVERTSVTIDIDLPPAQYQRQNGGSYWSPGRFRFYGFAKGNEEEFLVLQQRALEDALKEIRKATRSPLAPKEHREGLLVALDQILEDPRTQSVLRGEGWK